MRHVTKRLRRSWSLAAAGSVLFASACVSEPGGEETFELRGTTVLGTPADVGAPPLPELLRCVSSPIGEDAAGVPQVLRVTISGDAAGTRVTLAHGPQLRSHGGVWGEDRAVETRTVKRSGDGMLLQEGVHGGLAIELARDGAVVRGTLVDDQCYQRLEAELTCWNDLELFGSPWAGTPGLFGARFDWGTGRCVDGAGTPARNATPIEVVRETGNGECADLGGVALNGGDLAYPELDGWLLLGADLDGASLSFASLRWASLQGADLSGLDFGYATVEGFIDASTVLPDDAGACEITRSPWAGDSISCRR